MTRTCVTGSIVLGIATLVLGSSPVLADSTCGTWKAMAVPSPGHPTNVLQGVAASKDGTVAWAVGYTDGMVRQPLALWLNGDAWTMEPVPARSEASLMGVDVSPGGDVWAVGTTAGAVKPGLLAMRYRDGAWDVETTLGEADTRGARTPLPIPVTAGLYDVAAVSDDDVWVAGEDLVPILSAETVDPAVPLTVAGVLARWDGSHFKPYLVPRGKGVRSQHLRAISAAAPDDIWAVGYTRDASQMPTARTYHWDGREWHAVPNPAEGILYSTLLDVVAIAADDVWVVGDSALDGPLYLHWDGGAWKQFAAPDLASPWTVDGTAADDVWASSGAEYYHFDGDRWAIVPSGPRSAPSLVAAGDGVRRALVSFGRCDALAVGTIAEPGTAGLLPMAERLRPTKPSDPALLRLTGTLVGKDAARLAWTPPLEVPLAIVVQRCNGPADACKSAPGKYTAISTLPPDAATYEDPGLMPGNAYTYRVLAVGLWQRVASNPVTVINPNETILTDTLALRGRLRRVQTPR